MKPKVAIVVLQSHSNHRNVYCYESQAPHPQQFLYIQLSNLLTHPKNLPRTNLKLTLGSLMVTLIVVGIGLLIHALSILILVTPTCREIHKQCVTCGTIENCIGMSQFGCIVISFWLPKVISLDMLINHTIYFNTGYLGKLMLCLESLYLKRF